MFCYQCEQTAGGRGCEKVGVCGKDPKTAALQDLLIYAAKGISQYANRARQLGAKDNAVDVFVVEALFTTVTNVNFDAARLEDMIRKAATIKKTHSTLRRCLPQGRQNARKNSKVRRNGRRQPHWKDFWNRHRKIGIASARAALGDDLAGLQELLTYGLKGTAAYVDHARVLGKEDDKGVCIHA